MLLSFTFRSRPLCKAAAAQNVSVTALSAHPHAVSVHSGKWVLSSAFTQAAYGWNVEHDMPAKPVKLATNAALTSQERSFIVPIKLLQMIVALLAHKHEINRQPSDPLHNLQDLDGRQFWILVYRTCATSGPWRATTTASSRESVYIRLLRKRTSDVRHFVIIVRHR